MSAIAVERPALETCGLCDHETRYILSQWIHLADGRQGRLWICTSCVESLSQEVHRTKFEPWHYTNKEVA